MRFHGGTDVDDVLDAMDYAVYANDVQHIILDNLQFMLTNTRGGHGARKAGPFDKFDAQVGTRSTGVLSLSCGNVSSVENCHALSASHVVACLSYP